MHENRAAQVKGLILSAAIVVVIFSVVRFPLRVPARFHLASSIESTSRSALAQAG